MYCHATKFIQRQLRQVEESYQEFEIILYDFDCFHRKSAISVNCLCLALVTFGLMFVVCVHVTCVLTCMKQQENFANKGDV